METKIDAVTEQEVGSMQEMCEIRFDCNVKMYEMGVRTVETGGMFFRQEKVLPPQWFRCHNTLTLEMIKNCDEYQIGRAIKDMFKQLDAHVKKYEEKRL